jgi:hypothetical protein
MTIQKIESITRDANEYLFFHVHKWNHDYQGNH